MDAKEMRKIAAKKCKNMAYSTPLTDKENAYSIACFECAAAILTTPIPEPDALAVAKDRVVEAAVAFVRLPRINEIDAIDEAVGAYLKLKEKK